MKHVIVFKQDDRYAAWPANYGMWAWGNEIVLGFVAGSPDPKGSFHARDRARPFTTMQARSRDGGEQWESSIFPGKTPGGRALSADEHMIEELHVSRALDGPDGPVACENPVDFTNENFAIMVARTHLHAGTRAWYYTTVDRCATWNGPYAIPMFDQPGIAARTDYIVRGPESAMLFLTASRETETGSHVFCAETVDGGKSFQFVSWVSPEPESGYSIMPASVAISDSRLLVATREMRREPGLEASCRIDLYRSDDAGRSWEYVCRPVADTGRGGNPPTLTRLPDGRICMTYGYRNPPYGMRARVSEDDGATWGDEIVLRSGAGSHDLGYPRTVLRADGKLVTAYYYTDSLGGTCYIAATIWEP